MILYKRLLLVFVLAGLFIPAKAQFYNGATQYYGKNRVQFNEFFWTYYRYDNMEFYFYENSKKAADFAAKTANETLKDLQASFDYTVGDKFYFIVHSKLSHYRESNIGIDEVKDGTQKAGVSKVASNKVFLYFNGDYEDFNHQIREAITQIIVNRMMYGENWREVVKNSTLLNIPDWYVNGLISYTVFNWNAEVENIVKDGVISGRFDKFNRLNENETVAAGHSLWHYIAEEYGEDIIPNILYMARVSRNIESGFMFVIGLSLKELIEESNKYYYDRYLMDDELREMPKSEQLKIKSKRETVYNEFVVNSTATHVAFTTNKIGKWKVFVYDIENNKRTKIAKGGFKLDRENDYTFPQLEWHPTDGLLAIVVEKQSDLSLGIYDVASKDLRVRPLFKLDKVYDFSFSRNGKMIAISAVKNSQSDIYTYTLQSGNLNQITNDIYDDKNPVFVDGDQNLLWSSNRNNDTIEVNRRDDEYNKSIDNWDVYSFNIKQKTSQLVRLSNTPNYDETNPQFLSNKNYAWLSNQNGISNIYKVSVDSVISHVDTTIHYRYFADDKPATNFKRGVLGYYSNKNAKKTSVLLKEEGKYQFYVEDSKMFDRPYDFIEPVLSNEEFTELIEEVDSAAAEIEVEIDDEQISYIKIPVFSFDDNGNLIQPENVLINDEDSSSNKPGQDRYIVLKENKISNDALKEVELPQRRNYNLNFSATDVITSVDFEFVNQMYQPFNPPYQRPGMGTVVKVQLYDLFDDYKVEGGARFSFSQQPEMFISLENRLRRLDKKYSLARQTLVYQSNIDRVQKNFMHEFKAQYTWPFSEVSAIKPTLSLRNNRSVTMATERNYLNIKDSLNTLYGFKLEYVFDNVRFKGLNLKNGTQLKVFVEQYRELKNFDTDLNVVGLDFRTSTKIHRDIIWVFRTAASTSFGARKLVYYMGAMDNWIVTPDRDPPAFDMETNISNKENYFYQTIATPIRGFVQNARNGNSFALINNEIRFPIIRYFANKPIKSDFWSNFQVVAFNDIGTAWTGPDPFSDENAFNTITVRLKPIVVKLENKNHPIIAAAGYGLRTRIFGYFVKVDHGWGIENFEFKAPLLQFSVGLDI